jgi:acyl phosphate:glycerol-3-phosphate acyltransferase
MPMISTDPMILVLVAVLAYALGSVPFGVVMARVMGLGDLRQIGSGNIGATNVLRTGSKSAALATLVLDGAKGGVAVLIAGGMLGADAAQVAGLAAFVGHLYPVWLRFQGGKGVATFIGTVLALAWPVGLGICAVWAAVFAVTRISSLSALAAAGMSGFIAFVLGRFDLLALVLVLTVMIYAKHRANITRLRAGTEPRFGAKPL